MNRNFWSAYELMKRLREEPIMTGNQKIDRIKVGSVEPAEQLRDMNRACKTKGYWRDSCYLVGETVPQTRLTSGKGEFWPVDGGFYRTKRQHIDRWCITREMSERNIWVGRKEWES